MSLTTFLCKTVIFISAVNLYKSDALFEPASGFKHQRMLVDTDCPPFNPTIMKDIYPRGNIPEECLHLYLQRMTEESKVEEPKVSPDATSTTELDLKNSDVTVPVTLHSTDSTSINATDANEPHAQQITSLDISSQLPSIDSSTPITEYSCEYKMLNLTCEEGEVIKIIQANYGRLVRDMCNDYGDLRWSGEDCKAPNSFSIINNSCSRKQTCSIEASNKVFGDPCVETFKYLEVQYVCESLGTFSSGKAYDEYNSLSCEKDWSRFRLNCYLMERRRLNWEAASVRCQNLGGYLASIHSSLENALIFRLVYINYTNFVWIGRHDFDKDGTSEWEDGSGTNYTNWIHAGNTYLNMYPTSRNGVNPCAALITERNSWLGGRWEFKDCSTFAPYICKKRISDSRNATSSIDNDAFPATENSITKKDNISVSDSRNATSSIDNDAFPATENSSTEKDNISVSVSRNATSSMDNNAFPATENSITKKDNISEDFVSNGYVTTSSTNDPTPCEEGWTQYKQYCYIVKTDKTHWLEADRKCSSLTGGNLASIHSSEQNNFLADMMSNKSVTNSWIGLHDRSREHMYRWRDGSDVDFTDCKAWQPYGQCRLVWPCFELFSETHRAYFPRGWNDTPCYHEKNFICQKPILRAENINEDKDVELDVPIPSPSPARVDTSSHCEEGWLQYDQNCYILKRNRRTWNLASYFCSSIGGHLASIHSQNQNDFLKNMMVKKLVKTCWIGGFNCCGHRYKFQWEDGSDFDYINMWTGTWYLPRRNSVVMTFTDQRSGVWDIYPTHEIAPFICQKKIPAFEVTTEIKDNRPVPAFEVTTEIKVNSPVSTFEIITEINEDSSVLAFEVTTEIKVDSPDSTSVSTVAIAVVLSILLCGFMGGMIWYKRFWLMNKHAKLATVSYKSCTSNTKLENRWTTEILISDQDQEDEANFNYKHLKYLE